MLQRFHRSFLVLRILVETLRYELVYPIRGFRGVHRGLRRRIRSRHLDLAAALRISKAYELVSSFYWKPILCLERSVIVARVMHAYGIPAAVIIGYRFVPFTSHAWVEVDGKVVNDSAGFAEKMTVLERIAPVTSAAV
jgi:hypothetical protein